MSRRPRPPPPNPPPSGQGQGLPQSDLTDASENDTPARVALGQQLYMDKRLSKNDSQSCNTCHDVTGKKGGVDNQPTSEGAFGKRGDRNSPTSLNAGFHSAQFWDGRAKDLKEQAKGPVLNPVEMAMPDEATVAKKKLAAVPEYQFGRERPSRPGQSHHVRQHRRGHRRVRADPSTHCNDSEGRRPAEELKGLDLFLHHRHTTCHNGPVLGGKEPSEGRPDPPVRNEGPGPLRRDEGGG